jgi:2-methylcitrate dehydratase PrpD
MHTLEMKYPKGHAGNPMTDSELEKKFGEMYGSHGDAAERDALLRAIWNFDRATDVGRDVLKWLVPRTARDKDAAHS